jgi:tricarballylate dehydrogenase
VLLLEAAPREWRGGNSHAHAQPALHARRAAGRADRGLPEEEFWQDLLKVTGGKTDEALARLVIRESSRCRDWMRRHGVRFQPSLSGTLHLSRTNAFFMGGGKALVNAYYRSAEALGVAVRYDAPVQRLELQDGRFVAARLRGRAAHRGPRLRAGQRRLRVQPRMAARGLGRQRARRVAGRPLPDPRHALQPGRAAEVPARAGADRVGDPTQAHMVAIDARAPLYDGGICTRVDCVSLGMVVNREGERFYDEGEDFWPKRYAIWGRLVAQQPGQVGLVIIDAKAVGRFMPPVFKGARADTLPELARSSACPRRVSCRPCRPTTPPAASAASTTRCWTTAHRGPVPPKTHWARRSTRRRSTATRCGPA